MIRQEDSNFQEAIRRINGIQSNSNNKKQYSDSNTKTKIYFTQAMINTMISIYEKEIEKGNIKVSFILKSLKDLKKECEETLNNL